MQRLVLKNFRIVDADTDIFGSLLIENGVIKEIITGTNNFPDAGIIIDGVAFGSGAVLMPAFVDLHAHFRDPGFPEKETSPPSEVLESASLAAVAGGYGTVVCMANTKPVIDTVEKARTLKNRCDNLGLIDLYPVLSLTKNMEGKELSGIRDLVSTTSQNLRLPLMLSEDGKDVADDGLFLAAMGEAKRLGVPVSCHCDLGGEVNAVRRAIELGEKQGCHIHIAHVSKKETVEIIRKAKKSPTGGSGSPPTPHSPLPTPHFNLTCEVTPHHIGATENDAQRMGNESFGRVNPSLQTDEDRLALIGTLFDGTVDAVATDHAPHTEADKAAGAPGFSGLETAFAVCLSFAATLSGSTGRKMIPDVPLQRLSELLSENPARIIGLKDRGKIAAGMRADLVIVDIQARQKIDTAKFKSRGKCTPFADRELQGKILMTLNAGKIVFTGVDNV